MKELLGGKGANLAEMTSIKIPVPSGFTITTQACNLYYKENRKINNAVASQILKHLKLLEKETGKRFGCEKNPLLVSVRSGSPASMPGMMDSLLNLGLNDKTILALAAKTKNEKFALDTYRRFIQAFGDVVMNVPQEKFKSILNSIKNKKQIKNDTELSIEELKKIIEQYKRVIIKTSGKKFPQDVQQQLLMTITTVFDSWNNARAIFYRKLNHIDKLLGTAVNVQEMVFGNMGETSGTGVCFSRNPSTGENKFYGEYLTNAQGEDIVAGIRTPKSIESLKYKNLKIYKELILIKDKLESHYKDMQDIEFTIQEGKLYILQTRSGKRTSQAALRIAIDFVKEKLLTKEEALLKINPESLEQLLHERLDSNSKKKSELLTVGLPASPGAAVGRVVFNADDAKKYYSRGESVILVRDETSPEDIEGMNISKGILTSRGGMTSHAAVVARGMGKCCIVGCSEIKIYENKKKMIVNNKEFREGDFITLDGSTGEVFKGKLETIKANLNKDFIIIMEWVDKIKKLKVRANADNPKDAKIAMSFGAEGVGLCRTEHMFFDKERIKIMQEMILSDNTKEREKALLKLLPFQKKDFKELFQIVKKKPITIRLLDPPLHEFLPKNENEIKKVALEQNISIKQLKNKIKELGEVNPMLGHRGCRIGITYPEITKMQIKAIIEEAKKAKTNVEIMIPFVGNVREFQNQKNIIDEVAKMTNYKKYSVGTMIEIPRGALTADEIAKQADFFSFGTNDLTQMTLGYSRDDVSKFMPEYIDKGILKKDPFQTLDIEGVGLLIETASKKGKKTNSSLKLGVCGEHGGDPTSIDFFHKVGLDYISCSPYRVPIARLSAAQSQILNR